MMKTTEEIVHILAQHRPRLQAKYPIKTLAVFGSYARGTAGPESDVDILVEFSGRVGMAFISLGDELEELLGQRVGLVSRNGLKARHFERINGELIFC
ncbi:nucleotidyltransferase family protein [Cyclonatronum proteinivorum]|nr:nucleotidyltransferase family protein [Cyclonatronum proteinivorum]